jgi:hypothetical protein
MSKPTPSRVRVGGQLGPYAIGFRTELHRQGYSSSPAAGHLQLMAHLSRWLADRDLSPDELTVAYVQQFLDDRRPEFRSSRAHGGGLKGVCAGQRGAVLPQARKCRHTTA